MNCLRRTIIKTSKINQLSIEVVRQPEIYSCLHVFNKKYIKNRISNLFKENPMWHFTVYLLTLRNINCLFNSIRIEFTCVFVGVCSECKLEFVWSEMWVSVCVCVCTKLGAIRSSQCHVATNATIYLHFIFKSQFPFQQMLRNAVRLPKFDKGLRPFLAQVSALILA